MEDSYFSIQSPAVGEYKEKGSKFLAYAFPMENESELLSFIQTLRTEHPKARHYCFAYRLGINGTFYRMNDDGEPSGTAGKPIFGQLLSYDVSDVLIVVVRYFGGTKLGASGLIQAYKQAASEALLSAVRQEKILTDGYEITTPLSDLGHVFFVVKSLDLEMGETVYTEKATIPVKIRKSKTHEILPVLKANLLKIPLDQALTMEKNDWGHYEISNTD